MEKVGLKVEREVRDITDSYAITIVETVNMGEIIK